jgi:nucleotide-binding universal stress UspA family protein
MRFHKILVAIDNSQLSHSVFAAALELAKSNKAAIMLLHCVTTDMVAEATPPIALETTLPLGLVNTDYQTQQILLEKQIEEAQALLKGYREEAMSHGVPTQSDYQVGEAGDQLCEVAKDWGADLIVVGRQGHTGLKEALLGSVSNHVVHHAPCSVLVIQQVEPEPAAEAVNDLSSLFIDPARSQEPT